MSNTSVYRKIALRFPSIILLSVYLVACGGGGGGGVGSGVDNVQDNAVNTSVYSVTGTVQGLAPNLSMRVEDVSGAQLAVIANGSYTFVAGLSAGTRFDLRVTEQPKNQNCRIINGSGAIDAATISNVQIHCKSLLVLLAGNTSGPGNADGPGTYAAFNSPMDTAVDALGNVYVSDTYNHIIRKITPEGEVSTLAGLAGYSDFTDGVGSAARFSSPRGIAVDSDGNVYVADNFNSAIRIISPSGSVKTLTGPTSQGGFINAAGEVEKIDFPVDVVLDDERNVYVVEGFRSTIRKITPSGVIHTIASSTSVYADSNIFDAERPINYPMSIAIDSDKNIYVADTNNHTIRKITPAGKISTLAGKALEMGTLDGNGSAARFTYPYGISVDRNKNVFVSDFENSTIRKLTPSGQVTTIAGNVGVRGFADGDGQTSRFAKPSGLATDALGNLYVADKNNNSVRKISTNGLVSTIAGHPIAIGYKDGVGSMALFNEPHGIAADSLGNFYVADTKNSIIRKISADGEVSTLAGAGGQTGSNDGVGMYARFNEPEGISVDPSGNVYVADTKNCSIRKITPSGWVTTIAGESGQCEFKDGIGNEARFTFPAGLTIDSTGNIYVADTWNNTVRKITPNGVVSTFAGPLESGNSNNPQAIDVQLRSPGNVVVDSLGNLYVADTFNSTIRKITPARAVTTYAGVPNSSGLVDGPAQVARFICPSSLAIDTDGSLFVGDECNDTVRKITPDGMVSTVVGQKGSLGVSLTELPASLYYPRGIAVSKGKLFITTRNGVVWVHTP